jgi:beta-lactamase superfamily II metal-dependent hydrolase
MKYLVFLFLLFAGRAAAQPLPQNPGETVEVRVLDVGAGLCNLIKMPGNKYIIYDAGGDYNTNGNRTLEQIKHFIPAGSEIELLVLSHTDADHIVAAGQVLREYKVKKLLWGGYERSMIDSEPPTAAYQRIITALQATPATINVNLNQRDSVITPGNHFTIGTTTITFLCGFGKPLEEWGLTDKAEKLNAVSIVLRLDYSGNSVLFCGDAVGRHRDDPEDALIATEKFMVEHAAQYLPSTVIIAPHHGAKNGSSTAKAVIFSAGHQFHHPETSTALRYLKYVSTSSIFRTDRGDDEGGTEWDYLRVPGTKDGYNDDNIDILLKSDHSYKVFYLDN